MPGPTRRSLKSEAEAVKEQRGSTGDVADVSVRWRDAEPVERPSGMAWDSSDGGLTYDAWTAQQRALDALSDGSDIVAFPPATGRGSR